MSVSHGIFVFNGMSVIMVVFFNGMFAVTDISCDGIFFYNGMSIIIAYSLLFVPHLS